MWNVKRGIFALLTVMLVTATVSVYANPAIAGQAGKIHVTDGVDQHQAVQGHVARVTDARQFVSETLKRPEVQRQTRVLGLDTEALVQRVSVLGDAEVLALQAQLMPFEEQMQTAGLENKVLIPLLAAIAIGLTIVMFMFAY